jgi:hypothetical protein
MNNPTIKAKVLEYIKANPAAPYKEVAAVCGTTTAYIYTVMPKKKMKIKKPVASAAQKKEPSDKKYEDLLFAIESEELINQELEDEIKRLNIVIDYLEGKLIENKAVW